MQNDALFRLIKAIQDLSLARDLKTVMEIVKHTARELTGADGATFVLRDKDCCYYADEDAISPLWKGQRFPMSVCISGWVMLNKQPAVIDDIYKDPRIPADAYKPTFVKSLAMVPIRSSSPIGAIGNYWAHLRHPEDDEVKLLEALANSTSIAMENVQLYNELEQRVQDRTAKLNQLTKDLTEINQKLTSSNDQLQEFSYAASHDLKEPLRMISSYVQLLQKRYQNQLDQDANEFIQFAVDGVERMTSLINGLLAYARIETQGKPFKPIEAKQALDWALSNLQELIKETQAAVIADSLPTILGDEIQIGQLLQNLIGNALHYRQPNLPPKIHIGISEENDHWIFSIQDNGIGIDPQFHQRIFKIFQRLHTQNTHQGTGVGLTVCKKIVERHHGKIWIESQLNKGSTFYFTLPKAEVS